MPPDQSIPLRLVGTHEYLNAIQELVQLIEKSNAEQIEFYDKLIAEQPEFSYISGRHANMKSGQEEQSNAARVHAPQFQKSSLAWMLALARVEVGATVAMYGNAPNAFQFIAPEKFGVKEYLQILTDDVAAHLLNLGNDPGVQKAYRRSATADAVTIAYLRRLKIIEDMLLILQNADLPEIAQAAAIYSSEVQRYRKRLMGKVESATVSARQQYEKSDKKVSDSTYISRVERGSVTALSPIERACQRRFLRTHGR